MTLSDMLNEQVTEQCCFACPGFANDIDVIAVIGGRNAKGLVCVPTVPLTDDDLCFRIHGSKTSRHSCHCKIPRVV
jgi:hypothetical protein